MYIISIHVEENIDTNENEQITSDTNETTILEVKNKTFTEQYTVENEILYDDKIFCVDRHQHLNILKY